METGCAPSRDMSASAAVDRGLKGDGDDSGLLTFWRTHGKQIAAVAGNLAGGGRSRIPGRRTNDARTGAAMMADTLALIRSYIDDSAGGPPAAKAVHRLAHMASRLMTDARKACDHEGVAPTSGELYRRVAGRLGLEAGPPRFYPAIHADAGGRFWIERAPIGRMAALADEVLGERERIVFFARTISRDRDRPSLVSIAGELAIDVDRVRAIEMSARRKIAAALASDGSTQCQSSG